MEKGRRGGAVDEERPVGVVEEAEERVEEERGEEE